ncbi:MAG: hypothetical protein HQ546_07450, partial [Planctomycetes bacterium]|nr:hypothetical protein [Planctomycetota bacterium]
VMVVPLLKADAVTLATVLNEMLRPSGEGQVTTQARALQEHIRLLRISYTDGHEPPQLDLTRPIKITSDPPKGSVLGSNSLILSSTPDNLKCLKAIVELMDTVPVSDAANVQLLHLKNADAESVKKVLVEIFTQGRQTLSGKSGGPVAGRAEPTDTQGKALVGPLNVSADLRTNSLVLSGPPETLKLAEQIVEDLDRDSRKIVTEVRLFRLKHADASRMAPTLKAVFDEAATSVTGAEGIRTQVTRLVKRRDTGEALITEFPKGRPALTIQADETTNTLVVAARSDVMALIADVIYSMDIPGAGSMSSVRIFPLVNADAVRLAEVVKGLYTGPNAKGVRAEDVPAIEVDTRTNAIIVSASDKTFAMLTALLARLDSATSDPGIQLVVIPLAHIDAGAVGSTIQSIFEARLRSRTQSGQVPPPQERVNVASEPLANALIVSASKENLALIRGLLAKVDVEPPVETGVVRIYALKHADATRLGELLKNLISQGMYKPGAVAAGDNKILAAREKASVIADPRTNVLIVSASRENFAVIEEIIRRIDLPEDSPVLGDVRTYMLSRANATRLAPMLQKFFDAKRTAEQAVGESGRTLAVTIVPDERTNALLVAGSRESFQNLEKMISELDSEQVVPASEFRVFTLTHATAAALEPTIKELFARRAAPGKQELVTVVADPRSNALIVGATPEDMKTVADLIGRLDARMEAPGEQLQVFALHKADAQQVWETIKGLYEAQGGLKAAGVNLSVNERINAIIVGGGKGDVDRIGELIARLDGEDLARVTEIHVFTLRNADASELADLLTATLTSKPKAMTAESPNRQTLLQFIRRLPDGKKLVTRALQEGVLITADRRANALVVTAPVETMALFKNLIEALDSVSPRTAQIKTFVLKNADARQMAEILQELFRLKNAPANPQAVNYTLVTSKPTTNGQKSSATIGSAEQYALTVTVDSRTNTLLGGGTQQYVNMAAEVIEELDARPAAQRVSAVYRLRNAKASDIEKAVRGWLDQERQRLIQALGADNLGAGHRLLEQEVAIVAVTTTSDVGEATTRSNTLLISASPRYFQTIERMIRTLDEPQPQVLVDVVLAEVTLDDTDELGVDWNMMLSANNGKQSVDFGTRFGVEAGIDTAAGFNLSVTGGDLNFFLRALQSQGRLHVLNRPQIMAFDNQEAKIDVGQSVPVVTSSRVTDSGVINTVSREDVGIMLTITPRISPDGFVRMEVASEVSSISSSNVQISEDFSSPIFNKMQANTTVTVQDGHTIVIGGLITTSEDLRKNKVPLLGDLPLLGALFKSSSLVKNRTELLIILRPRIVRKGADADRVTGEEIRRLNLAEKVGEFIPIDDLFNPLEPARQQQSHDMDIMGDPAKTLIDGPGIAPLEGEPVLTQ